MPVKPVASPAYSMVHGVLLLRELAAWLPGKQVMWFVCCGNDLADNLRPDMGDVPYAVGRPNRCGHRREVSTGHGTQLLTFGRFHRDNDVLYAHLCAPSAYRDRVFAAADFLVGEAAESCRNWREGMDGNRAGHRLVARLLDTLAR